LGRLYNPQDEDGEWNIVKLVAVRGPPERRFWKIQWESPDPDQEYSISQQQEHNTRDKGTAAFGWEPQPHLEGATAKRNFQLQLDFWHDHPDLNPRGSIESEAEWRCVHCNLMSSSATKHIKHCRGCRFRPRRRAKTSKIGKAVEKLRTKKRQLSYPKVEVAGVQVQTDATRRYLGHIEDAQATSDSDVAAKLQQWVKVRGHSKNVGNDAADKAATWGQNGGSKNVENLQECMEWLLASTQTQATDDAEANVDDDVDADVGSADAVTDADADDTEY